VGPFILHLVDGTEYGVDEDAAIHIQKALNDRKETVAISALTNLKEVALLLNCEKIVGLSGPAAAFAAIGVTLNGR
jgi:hypothetical protein